MDDGARVCMCHQEHPSLDTWHGGLVVVEVPAVACLRAPTVVLVTNCTFRNNSIMVRPPLHSWHAGSGHASWQPQRGGSDAPAVTMA